MLKKSRVRIVKDDTSDQWWVQTNKDLLGWWPARLCDTQEEATEWALKIKENLEHPQEYEI